MNPVSLGSDNHSGVHPILLEEMLRVNQGFAPSYGQDEYSKKLRQVLLKEFDAHDASLVFNGTAANVICLQVALQPYHSVICSDCSHLNVDECGAPEKIAGVKLIPVDSVNGKIQIDKISENLIRKGDQHFSQVKMISITQPTEYGTLYSDDEIQQIHEICQIHDLYLHIDGARLPNAAVALNKNFKNLVQHADLVSFGGAKNGLLLGEFVIVRNKQLKQGLKFFRKQSLQLPSKTRFLAAPFLKYLESSLWQEIAQHENAMALRLREGLGKIPEVVITQPTQANSVFCILPQEVIKELRKHFFFYVWDEKTLEVRLMTSFSVTAQHIDDFISLVSEVFAKRSLK